MGLLLKELSKREVAKVSESQSTETKRRKAGMRKVLLKRFCVAFQQ